MEYRTIDLRMFDGQPAVQAGGQGEPGTSSANAGDSAERTEKAKGSREKATPEEVKGGGAAEKSGAAHTAQEEVEAEGGGVNGAKDTQDAQEAQASGQTARVTERARQEGMRTALEAAERAVRRQSVERLVRASTPGPRVIADRLEREAAELSRRYPSFDLARELSNKRFRRLVRSGVTMSEAYEVLHAQELRAQGVRQAMQLARERGMRPEENGTAHSVSFTGPYASTLTPAGRAELARRAAAGERIFL